MRRALVIGHVAFEDLGTLAPALAAARFAVRTLQAGVDPLPAADALEAELLVVLGGPIGVYDEAAYPFLADEKSLIGERLRRGGVTLGICLGAQLMANALGAQVYPGSAGKEIGWSPLLPTAAGEARAELASLFAPAVSVLHWHGDTFDLPRGATHLAASARYAQQIFVYGDHGWGFSAIPRCGGVIWSAGSSAMPASWRRRVSASTRCAPRPWRGPKCWNGLLHKCGGGGLAAILAERDIVPSDPAAFSPFRPCVSPLAAAADSAPGSGRQAADAKSDNPARRRSPSWTAGNAGPRSRRPLPPRACSGCARD